MSDIKCRWTAGRICLHVFVAGFTAIIILSFVFCFYSLLPIHLANTKGNTDYIWPANSFWFIASEGIAFGRFDGNGFNNIQVIDDPDVLILGSSHMEAVNLMQSQTATTVFNRLQSVFKAYNQGISGHDLYKTAQYLPRTLEIMGKAPSYVVIETSSVVLEENAVFNVLNHSVQYSESNTNGLLAFLQKSPFLRCIYHSLVGGLLNRLVPELNKNDYAETKAKDFDDDHINLNSYDLFFRYLQDVVSQYDTKLIIVYHPTGFFSKEGTLQYEEDEFADLFAEYAAIHDVSFINLKEDFLSMFYSEHHVAHGFSTGKLEYGHLNKFGHYAFAIALVREIQFLENEATL